MTEAEEILERYNKAVKRRRLTLWAKTQLDNPEKSLMHIAFVLCGKVNFGDEKLLSEIDIGVMDLQDVPVRKALRIKGLNTAWDLYNTSADKLASADIDIENDVAMDPNAVKQVEDALKEIGLSLRSK